MNVAGNFRRYRSIPRSEACTAMWPEDPPPAVFARAIFTSTHPTWFVPELLGALREYGDRMTVPTGVPMRVRRDILRDPQGRLYERIGEVIHPLTAEPPNQSEIINIPEEEQAQDTGARSKPAPESDPTPRRLLEPLLEGRVVKRLLRFAEWKHLLSSLLRHPERLADSHQLPCDIRLFELTAAATAEQLEKHGPQDLHLLDDSSMGRLGLTRSLPPSRPRASPAGCYRGGDRFFTIVVAHDPTAWKPPGAPQPPLPKTQVPEVHLRPWEFLQTREQAAAALAQPKKSPGWRSRLIRFLERDDRRAELVRWQTQLAGKALDEQLWAVRPPKDALGNPVVRDWATRTLAAAGYDAGLMFTEWEIYWTRKGI